MSSTRDTFSIGTLAKAAGVNVETIRFYQRKHLLAEPDRPPGGIRRYGHAEVARVKFVKSAQRLGFSLDEAAQLLRLEDGSHCTEAADLAALRLADVRNRLDDLTRMETALAALVGQCGGRRRRAPCPLIASLHAC
jgi:MerR family mercuric resistance operon transcriptional regulator